MNFLHSQPHLRLQVRPIARMAFAFGDMQTAAFECPIALALCPNYPIPETRRAAIEPIALQYLYSDWMRQQQGPDLGR
jgi:hypothetical protein